MIKLFSHSDLDGIGCAILGKLAFGDKLDYEICDYDNINEKVKTFYIGTEKNKYERVFITDISINEEVAAIIEKNKFVITSNLLDHHPTALSLGKYKWAMIDIMLNENEKTSGTRMFYNYLTSDLNTTELKVNLKTENIFDFVEIVRKYDVWQWKAENNLAPKQWNDLFYIMGREDFIKSVIYRLTHYDIFDFCDFDLKLLEYKQREIDSYIESKNKEIIVKEILGHKAGVVFGEQYHSELGNKLCELHPELDFIVIINMSKAVSYRSIGNKIDLGKDIASVYDGGGHPNAAGSPINDSIREEIISKIFNKA